MILVLILVVILILAVVGGRHLYFNRLNHFLAHAEYWVYSTAKQMPNQDQMMMRLVGENPYIQRGQNPIGAAEGLLFSDIRLKIALVLRTKNPNLFRGDKLPETIADQHEFVSDVSHFNSIIRLQYSSPMKLKDKRHLQFLLHAADAEAELTDATWIFDKVTGSLRSKQELANLLKENFDVTKPEFHVRLTQTEDNTFRSFGLCKIGVPDFETHPVPSDQLSLVKDLLDRYISLSWERGETFPDPIKAYDDEFFLLQKRVGPTLTQMRIVRKQMVP